MEAFENVNARLEVIDISMVELEFELKQFDSFQVLNQSLSLMVEFYRNVTKKEIFFQKLFCYRNVTKKKYIFLGNCLNNLQIFIEYLP